jgi:aminopeptidase
VSNIQIPPHSATADSGLKKYAELAVKKAVNLQPGQRLIVSAPLDAAPLVQEIGATAYQAGCRLVEVMWSDDRLTLMRYKHAPRDSFEEYPVWQSKGLYEEAKAGAAFLHIMGNDPDLLAEQDPALVSKALRTNQIHNKALSELRRRNGTNWSIITMPVPSWAAKVFPDLAPKDQVERLTEVIFSLCRVDREDPIAAWSEHIEALKKRKDLLNQKRYTALEFSAPNMDLKLGLPERHNWASGAVTTEAGVMVIPNMPTEEVFTVPHRDRVEGSVTASKPLHYRGMVFENFTFIFRDGRVINVKADAGEDLLRKIVETDEGSARLGEVALVAESSPVAQSGLLFYNSLLDENAACHLALGFAFQENIQGGPAMQPKEFEAAGGNRSQVHMDFMVGSNQLEVVGVTQGGTREPILQQGEWSI